MARISLFLIRAWQLTLGPVLGVFGGCRYHPSCSRYGYEAIHKYGFFKGWKLTLWRIVRCNPFTVGGYDPVP